MFRLAVDRKYKMHKTDFQIFYDNEENFFSWKKSTISNEYVKPPCTSIKINLQQF